MADKPYTITGIIDEVKPSESFITKSEKEFIKQEVILSIEGKYPNFVPIELTGDSVDSVSATDVGRKAEFSFFVNGRRGTDKFEGRVFVNLRYVEHSLIAENNDAAVPEVIEPKVWKVVDDEDLPF